MKKLLLPCLLFALSAQAQQKKPAPKTGGTAVKPQLKNLTDSASYAIGVSVANFYAQQGMKNLNPALIAKACQDIQSGKKAMLSDDQVNSVIMKYMNAAQQAKSKPNIEKGERFLAQNKTKPGIKTTASGLQYEVITQGTGVKPGPTDSVTCHYKGTLIDGTEFDNSYKRGEPITFTLDRVIRGWTEGLQLMPVGSRYRLFIPQQLGYGLQDAGAIPAGSVLLFEIELLDVPNRK